MNAPKSEDTIEQLGRNINALLCHKGAVGVSANEITKVVLDTLGDWTVKASDYDRCHAALQRLRFACKHKLTPGWYSIIADECERADAALANTGSEPTARTDARTRP